ncbi:2-dehydro-3-deoxygluconokinase [Paramicrobacterium humi]|uniref:2-dehydro-3-deoxygluconokinase n=1 Tax=Paramicrobacterium humi TaxID=640635 RepID=A0A1H4IPA8_9MICO|nr:sugar kinase [Microbacterium humi]SEB35899.1 2-dehydro-3-deoxygluconokinase [Microbacterium humi]
MMSEALPRVITIGETMVLVTPAFAEPLGTAADFHLDAGGAESNVASHLAHLGVPSAWVSAVGADALGDRLRATIESRGVDVRWVTSDPEAPTGVYFKDPGRGVLYYRRGSAASRMGPASISHVPLESADIVHVTGITPALSSSCSALLDTVRDRVADSDALLSFDVNHRSALWAEGAAAPVLRSFARLCDIVFVGLDEAQTLWGCETADDVRALLPEPDRLIVKDGDVGATEFHGTERVVVPAIPTEVIEAVGAGDAFAAGYLAATLQGASASDRLLAGHNQARLVLASTSDFLTEPRIQKG